MKKHFLKILLGGFIVFLTLPVIFDSDEDAAVAAAKKQLSQTNKAAESDEMLPVIPAKALPFRSENVLSKYASRFKRFYVTSAADKNEIRQEILNNENGQMYAYAENSSSGAFSSPSVRASAENMPVQSDFTDVSASRGDVVGAASQAAFAAYGAIPYGAASTKQKIHDNAPVKGLYESSATDSAEARVQAREVYSTVMRKVDKATGAVEEEPVASRPVGSKSAAIIAASPYEQAQIQPITANAAESKYVGIASKGSSASASAKKGSLSGFSGGGLSARESQGLSSDIAISDAFENNVNNAQNKVSTIVSRDKASAAAAAAGGASSAGGTSGQAAGAGQQNQTGQQNNQYGGNNYGDDVGPIKPTPPTQFDPNAWTPSYDPMGSGSCNADGSHTPIIGGDTKQKFAELKLKASSAPDSSLGPDNKKPNEEPNINPNPAVPEIAKPGDSSVKEKLDPACLGDVPHFGEGIAKYKVLVDLGVDKNGRRITTATSDKSALAAILSAAGAQVETFGQELSPKTPGFNWTDPREFDKRAHQKDVIVLTVSPERLRGCPNCVPLGDAETKEGMEKLVKATDEKLSPEGQKRQAKADADKKAAEDAGRIAAQNKDAQTKATTVVKNANEVVGITADNKPHN